MGYIRECSYYRRLGPRGKALLLCRKCPLGYIRECSYYGRLGPTQKHFCYAGNVNWVISWNAFITEGLVLGGNTFVLQEMTLGYIWECFYDGRLGPRRNTLLLFPETSLGLYQGMQGRLSPRAKHFCNLGNVLRVILIAILLLRKVWSHQGGKHFGFAGNVTWVISGNALITTCLVLGENTFVMQEMPIGLYLGILLLRKAWS